MTQTEAQKRAQKKYREKNKDKQRYWDMKSRALAFVEIAQPDDLKELEKKAKKHLHL